MDKIAVRNARDDEAGFIVQMIFRPGVEDSASPFQLARPPSLTNGCRCLGHGSSKAARCPKKRSLFGSNALNRKSAKVAI
jgi:hypothetical protein